MMKLFLFCTLAIATRCSNEPFDYAGMVFYDENDDQQVVPLSSVDTSVDVRGLSVGVTAQLIYENPTDDDVECHFIFPLSSNAAVYKLEALIGGRKLVAKVEEREDAERKYKKAFEAGKKAILLRNKPGVGDVFKLSLGNLPAYSTALVDLGYVQPVDRIYSDGLISVTLPMVLNPRYVPFSDLVDRNLDDLRAEDDNFVSVSNNDFSFTFDASVELGIAIPIKSIRTKNSKDVLQIEWTAKKSRADVTLLSEFEKNQDFQLLIEPGRPFEPIVTVEPRVYSETNTWLSNDVAGAWIVPDKESVSSIQPSNLEIWVVLDRSGSMRGDKFADARKALLTLISELPEGCFFNLLSFGSNFSTLFQEGPRRMAPSLRNEVVTKVKNFDADLAGTEILKPLESIYKRPKVVPHKRSILLLTDGGISNAKDVISLCARNSNSTKVFSIGIGQGASTALVNGVSRASGGLSAFVRGSNDRVQLKTLEMLDFIIRPVLDDSKLQWSISPGGYVKELIPEQIYGSFSGTSLFQYAVISHFKTLTVSGSAVFSASNYCYQCIVRFKLAYSIYSDHDDPLPLHRLAAKALLTELEDRYSLNSDTSTRQQAVEVSKATGVLCDFTALLAVEAETSKVISTFKNFNEEYDNYDSNVVICKVIISSPLSAGVQRVSVISSCSCPTRAAMGFTLLTSLLVSFSSSLI